MAAARTDARAVVLLSAGLLALGGGCKPKGRPPRDPAAEAGRLMAEAEEIEAEDLVEQLECLRDAARRGLDVAGELREAKDELESRKANAGEFSSRLKFAVLVRKTPQGGFDEIGKTPAAQPVVIPPCYSWGVCPIGDVSDPDALRPFVAEVERLRAEGLYLRATGATDDGLAHLKGLTELRELRLYEIEITDAGLAHLKTLSGLRVLRLPHQITDAGLAHLKGLKELRKLLLLYTKITDAGLVHLKGLTGLRVLSLWHTKVTDAGLAHLKGLTGLRNIRLWRTKVTKAGVRALEEALPELKVIH